MDRPGKRGFASLAAALALGAGVGAGAYAIADNGGGASASAASQQHSANTSAGQPAAVSSKTLTVGQVYAKDSPGVVKITVTTSAGGGGAFPFGGGGGGTSTAQGSGFVYDSAGHVITNEHVIDGAGSVKVRFSNGKTYSATVVGSDTSSDLAVLKV